MFSPKWKKEAQLLHKGAKKFLHYKRDLLKPDRIDEIESRRADLAAAIKAGDRAKVDEASKQLRATCEGALPRSQAQTWWEENIEVIWVALVIALGLRAYVIQPFRIPTGSMQPTLNGITLHKSTEEGYKKPWIGGQALEFVLRGSRYTKFVAKNDCEARSMQDVSWFLFTRTLVTFSDGSKVKVPAAENETQRALGLQSVARDSRTGAVLVRSRTFRKGETIFEGRADSGDLVLVNKVSYHFRRPERGEVFVFDTRGILTDSSSSGNRMADQLGGTHYIKRLCGVPGDTLRIETPNLWVNGKIAQEPGIQRVIRAEGIYGADPDGTKRYGYIPAGNASDQSFFLDDRARPGMREYAALGDNTSSSLDSRYWGSVKEFNLAGPALFSLWPITTGHWGLIR